MIRANLKLTLFVIAIVGTYLCVALKYADFSVVAIIKCEQFVGTRLPRIDVEKASFADFFGEISRLLESRSDWEVKWMALNRSDFDDEITLHLSDVTLIDVLKDVERQTKQPLTVYARLIVFGECKHPLLSRLVERFDFPEAAEMDPFADK